MAAGKTNMLPQNPSADDAFVTIVPFETGQMVTPAATLIGDAQGLAMGTSWRFLLKHAKTGTNFWFDMGLSHDLSVYPPSIQKLHAHFKPVPSKVSMEQETVAQNVDPATIKHVIVSHAHWDHIYPLPSSFTGANMIVGPGSIEGCSENYPASQDSKFDGRIWDSALRTFPLEELPPTSDTETWKPLGPFPHTYDFFNDGSLYLIDAPGHMQGNIAALARIKTETGAWKWVVLGGDCAHCDVFTYWPDAPFGKMPKALFPSGSLHEFAEAARETIVWIAECKKIEGNNLLVWYAHSPFLEGAWEL